MLIRLAVTALLLGVCSFSAAPGSEALVSNGDLESAEADGTHPAQWPRADGVAWALENDNHYLHFGPAVSEKNITLPLRVAIPAGTGALRLSYRIRYKGVVPAEKNGGGARLTLTFKTALDGGKNVNPAPRSPSFRDDSKNWEERSLVLMAPDGVGALELVPGLVNVKSGTMDLDDVECRPAIEDEILKAKADAEAREPLPAPPVESAKPDAWPPELHVVGNRLQDRDGHDVHLQGMNIDSLEWRPTGESILRQAQVGLEDWKANILRLPVTDSFWFGESGGQKDGGAAYRELIDAVVNLAANRRAYVLIDLHRYRAIQAKHLRFWTDVAAKYKNHPAVLFDLFNEPHDISWDVWRNGGHVTEKPSFSDEDAFLSEEEKRKRDKSFDSPGMQAAVNAIREADAKNIIVAGGVSWSGRLAGIADGYALEEKGGNGIMYSWHCYNWSKDWQGRVMAVAAKYPVLVGECGAGERTIGFIGDGLEESPWTWSPIFLAFLQKHGLHWTAFSMHPGCGPSMVRDWKFNPTAWGAFVKEALAGKQFEYKGME